MIRRLVAFALALTLALTLEFPASADPCSPPACGDAVSGDDGFSILTRVGRVKAPFVTDSLPRVESEFTAARLLIASGHWRVRDDLVVGLRIPTAPSSVRQPGGSYVADNIFGNIELFAEQQSAVRWGRARLRARLRAALGLPTAGLGSTSEISENRGLAISNALDGWRQPELYEPGVVPVVVAAKLDAWLDPVRLVARFKLPVLVRVSDGGYPDDAVTAPVGIVPIIEAGASYWPVSWFGVGANAFAVFRAPAPVAPGRRSDRGGQAQLGIEPSLHVAIANHVVVVADLALPIGGPLSETLGIGFSIAAYR